MSLLLDRPADYEVLVSDLRHQYASKPLAFGCGGYAPFVKRNGTIEGPMYELFEEVATELRTTAYPLSKASQGGNWATMLSELGRNHIKTIADPVIPSTRRPLMVVPYVTLVSGVLLFDTRHEWAVNAVTESLYQLASDSEMTDVVTNIRDKVYSLSSLGRGLAVTDGVVEQSFLDLLKVPISQTYPYPDIIDNTVKAVSDDYVAFLDYPSARMALDKLGSDSFKYSTRNLFGRDHPLRTWAGFAFCHPEQKLQRYFHYHSTKEDGLVRKAIRGLDTERLQELKIEIIPPEEIPPEPVEISMAEFFLIQILNPNWLAQSRKETQLLGLGLQPAKDELLVAERRIEMVSETIVSNRPSSKLERSFLLTIGFLAGIGILLVVLGVAFWFGNTALAMPTARAGLLAYICCGLGIESTVLSGIASYVYKRSFHYG